MDLAADGMALAESLNDPGMLMEALFMPGVTMFYRAQFAGARAYYENALAAYDDRERTKFWTAYTGHDAGVTHRCYLALALWHLGYPDQALKLAREMCELAATIGHAFSLGHAVDFAAFLYHYCRLGAEVQAAAEEEMAIATEQGFPFWHALGTLHKGAGLLLQGRREEALPLLLKGFERLPGHRGGSPRSVLPRDVGRCLHAGRALRGRAQGAGRRAGGCREERRPLPRGRAASPQGRVAAGRIRRRGPPPRTASAGPSRAPGGQQSKAWELRATMSLARLWQRQGRRTRPATALAAVYGTYTEGFTTPDLVDAKGLLDELAVISGK